MSSGRRTPAVTDPPASAVSAAETIDLAYSEQGRGEPLVLIMGLSADRTAWAPHVQAYASKFRCFAVDNRGVGGSAMPPGPYSTARMADDYARLIRRLDLAPIRAVGISMGGAIAQELALGHPELVSRLVLVSTWARCEAYTAEVFSHFAKVRAQVSPSVFAALLQLWIWTPEYVNAHLAELIEARDAQPSVPQPRHAFEAQCAACIGHDASERLPGITVPTLITAGSADIFTPVGLADQLHAGIGGSELHVFENSGHAHHWEQLDSFNQLTTEWLS
jgi:pimeloyl-ACP methyl ester carboxylesterase